MFSAYYIVKLCIPNNHTNVPTKTVFLKANTGIQLIIFTIGELK